jgi:RNA polymerase sigma-70 factor (ECF subfamily)
LEKARTGDGEAARQLAERYESKIRVVARAMLSAPLRPYLDSVDVVQSVHKSLLAGIKGGKFDLSTPENLIALAVTVVRRKVARQWRHLQKQQRLSRGDASAGRDAPAERIAAVPGAEKDPARDAELRDAAQRVMAALDETEQRMLEMQAQGHSTAEIAAELGLNPVALRVRLSRLKKRLQEGGIGLDAQ